MIRRPKRLKKKIMQYSMFKSIEVRFFRSSTREAIGN